MKYVLCILHRDKDLSTVKARNYKPSTTNVPDCVKCPLSVKCLIQVRGSINLGLLKNSNIHNSAIQTKHNSGSRKYQAGSAEELKY